MVPGEASFPPSLRRVAVVNNMPHTPETGLQPEEVDTLQTPYEVARKTEFYTGNDTVATEALAEALADGNYFDQVIICDSALRAHDRTPRESLLSAEEVDALTHELGADFLIALENVQLRVTSRLHFFPEININYGTVDIKTYTTCRIYLPGRRGAIGTIRCTDSIFWEEPDLPAAKTQLPLIPQNELIEFASDFAGSRPVDYLLPHWKTAARYLFTGGNVDMRDAAVYVREQNWPAAIELWQHLYEKKKGKQKVYAAYNIALGYEMQDSIQMAVTWAEKAVQASQAIVLRHVEGKGNNEDDFSRFSHYTLAYKYLQELQERLKNMAFIKAQMQRFENEPE